MVDYQHSTQLQRWTFTQEKLDEIRDSNRQRSIKSIEARLASNGDASTSNGNAAAPPLDNLITLEEERLFCAYYQHKAQEICATALPHFPRKVAATAVMYVKRFYTTRSLLDQHPAVIMLAAIYLAGKVEEFYVSAEDFARQVAGVNADVLLKTEPLLVEALKYDLIVYTPYKAIDGFLHDLDTCDASTGVDPTLLDATSDARLKAKQRAYSAADVLMRSDAPLLYPPGTLALAALRSAFRKGSVAFTSYLQRVVSKANTSANKTTTVQMLEADLERLDAMAVATAQEISKEQAAAVDRKLKLCNNAGGGQTGGAGGDKQARKEKKAARKAKRRAEEAALLEGDDGRPASKLQKLFDDTGDEKRARID